ncbi:uncharacterized protein LOC110058745 [Orbicella faveolata]|uniref:uncharacterized protein LOC110058745 n=1 Tax=Orbicella faveolata TaxID=48498 RepID=UPI0009E3078F|nr:uncharacterized protein LOC110058745 [Orbicella faveolata]
MTCEKCSGGSESSFYNSRCKMYVTVILFNSQACAFKGFSVISAMLGGGLACVYFILIMIQARNRNYDQGSEIAILAMISTLNFIEFFIGIWAATSVYKMRICCFYSPSPQRQVMYTANSDYALTQGPAIVHVASQMQLSGGAQESQPQAQYGAMTSGYQPQRIDLPPSYEEGQHLTQQKQQASNGVPVAVRIQTGARIVADQTIIPEAQDNQPQIVLLPDSREMDDPPPAYEAVATGYQTLQVDLPPSYEEAEHGQLRTYV